MKHTIPLFLAFLLVFASCGDDNNDPWHGFTLHVPSIGSVYKNSYIVITFESEDSVSYYTTDGWPRNYNLRGKSKYTAHGDGTIVFEVPDPPLHADSMWPETTDVPVFTRFEGKMVLPTVIQATFTFNAPCTGGGGTDWFCTPGYDLHGDYMYD